MKRDLIAGVGIGRTKVAVALAGANGEVIFHCRFPADVRWRNAGQSRGRGLRAAFGNGAAQCLVTVRGRATDAERESLAAAFELLERANSPGALVIFLVSGGGSAMMEMPRATSTFPDDLQAANTVQVDYGARMGEANAVRRRILAVKGGGLSRAEEKAKSAADRMIQILSRSLPGPTAWKLSGRRGGGGRDDNPARGNADLNAGEFLANSDHYSFFAALNQQIETGATGTNVRDIRILLAR